MLDQAKITELASQPLPPFHHIIDGEKRPASGGGTLNAISPLDGSVLTTMARGSVEDAEAGIAAARKAFDDGRWSVRSALGFETSKPQGRLHADPFCQLRF